MATLIYYPSIDLDGWVAEVGQKLDRLMADFYCAEYSQDYVFYGSISSLPYIIQQNSGDMSQTAIKIRSTLEQYLMKYFENVYVECSEVISDTDGIEGILNLYLEVSDNGETIKLRNLLKVDGTYLSEIRKILV